MLLQKYELFVVKNFFFQKNSIFFGIFFLINYFFVQFLVEDGETVTPGTALFEMDDSGAGAAPAPKAAAKPAAGKLFLIYKFCKKIKNKIVIKAVRILCQVWPPYYFFKLRASYHFKSYVFRNRRTFEFFNY